MREACRSGWRPPSMRTCTAKHADTTSLLPACDHTRLAHAKVHRQLFTTQHSQTLLYLSCCRSAGRKLRCVGSGLSPNGLGFSEEGMVSLALMDRVLSVDKERQQVRNSAE